jgi:hypothetical protein
MMSISTKFTKQQRGLVFLSATTKEKAHKEKMEAFISEKKRSLLILGI